MARVRYRWAKIRGAYRLSRRNIARIVAAISAAMLWFHTATAALSPADKALMRRASGAMCTILPIEDSMPDGEPHVAVSDHVFAEFAEVFFGLRPYLGAKPATVPPVAWPGRRYPTRKSITVPMAAAITGLSESTIKRLDKDPKNTNYPGRNSSAKILAAWAKMYRGDRLAAHEVRAANRPCLGLGRS